MTLQQNIDPALHCDNIYLDHLTHILEKGVKREDRTGVGTIGVFGTQQRYDLTLGFPLLTTKRVYTRGVIGEMIFFLTGRTDNQWLNDQRITIWDEWRRPYTLNRPVIQIEGLKPMLPNILKTDPTDIGRVLAKKGNPYGFILDELDEIDIKLLKTWRNMMQRCYTQPHKVNYYGRIFVVDEWHDPKTFLLDAKKLPHWWYKKQKWDDFDLDKDYYGANFYGPESCVWLSSRENKLYAQIKPYEVVFPSGDRKVFLTLEAGEKALKLLQRKPLVATLKNTLTKNKKGENIYRRANKHLKDYKISYVTPASGSYFRLELIEDDDLGPIYGSQWRHWQGVKENPFTFDMNAQSLAPIGFDQIAKVLHDLKHNPFSRRHIVSAWNPAAVEEMALPPCHTMFQFYVTPDADGKPFGLSCHLYQRSMDSFLGQPFNIASYAAITHLFADLVGLVPLEFIHTAGDAHIYLNHFEQVQTQMARRDDLRPMPHLTINHPVAPEDLDLSDPHIFERYTVEDFVFSNYDPHPAISAPIAV